MIRFESVYDLREGEAEIRRGRFGIIEMRDGQFYRIRFRPWPKVISLPEMWWDLGVSRGPVGDQCRLYYNQSLGSPNYLALKYIVSNMGASFASFRRALLVLDEVARIKQTDAIVCEASNQRISPRLLQRWGWEPHCPTSRRRHYIKRFYGSYPTSCYSPTTLQSCGVRRTGVAPGRRGC